MSDAILTDFRQFKERMEQPGAISGLRRELLAQGPEQIDTYQGVPVLRAGRFIFATTGDRPGGQDHGDLAYFVRVQEEFIAPLGLRCITQAPVAHSDFTFFFKEQFRGLPRHVFWRHLLPMHGAVISFLQQTPDAQAFWRRRMLEAFGRGLHVTALDELGGQTGALRDFAHFTAARPGLYGRAEHFAHRRLVISERALESPTGVLPLPSPTHD